MAETDLPGSAVLSGFDDFSVEESSDVAAASEQK